MVLILFEVAPVIEKKNKKKEKNRRRKEEEDKRKLKSVDQLIKTNFKTN